MLTGDARKGVRGVKGVKGVNVNGCGRWGIKVRRDVWVWGTSGVSVSYSETTVRL